MLQCGLYILAAYLSGSVLYANVFGTLFGVREKYAAMPDANPGVANAYVCGGFWCGTLALLGDLAKAAVPVWLFTHLGPLPRWGLPLLLAAPVVGHILPVFYGFHGGKGIAASFGALLGLTPYLQPFMLFAASFIFFSVVVRISPHYYRTIAAYLLCAVLMVLRHIAAGPLAGYLVITAAVCTRMALSREQKARCEVGLLWKH